jgi:UPF0755 protein
MKRFLLILAALALIAAGAVEWAIAAWNASGPAAPEGNQTVVLIKPGTSLHRIAEDLRASGMMDYPLLFEAGLRVTGQGAQVKAGEYAIASRASMKAIAAILVAGKSIQHKLTAAEGLTSQMIYDLVVREPALSGDAGPVPAEGTLLPETYLFTRGTPRRKILDEMEQAQRRYLDAQWAHRAEGLPFADIRQAVILASVVEKETALPEERRHIAAVFINRLKIGMPLQSDPTIIYGLTRGYPLGHGIRQSELDSATPYNTYHFAGLPPGPICNPGKDSIAAVLHPEKSSDIYFVASGNGGHVFSDNIAQHQRNVAALRALERRQQKASVAPSRPAPRRK